MYIYIYSSVAKICKRTKTHNDNTNKTTGTKKISLVKMNGDQKRTLIDNKYWKG